MTRLRFPMSRHFCYSTLHWRVPTRLIFIYNGPAKINTRYIQRYSIYFISTQQIDKNVKLISRSSCKNAVLWFKIGRIFVENGIKYKWQTKSMDNIVYLPKDSRYQQLFNCLKTQVQFGLLSLTGRNKFYGVLEKFCNPKWPATFQ